MNKLIKVSFFILVSAVTIYFIFNINKPTIIVGVHQNKSISDVLVKNFPYTNRGKLQWWQENKEKLKKYFNIPGINADGTYTIIIWDFGDGYTPPIARNSDMLPGYDTDYLYCFDDMKVKANCIHKNQLMTVTKSTSGRVYITTNKEYLLEKNGEFLEQKEE